MWSFPQPSNQKFTKANHEVHESDEIRESKGMTRFAYFAFAFVPFVVHACSSSNPEVRAVMQSPIAPASDAIFNAVVYTNGALASSPQTDEQWARLRTHAQSLQDAGGRLLTMAPRENAEQWEKQSVALVAASGEALKAIDGRSLDGVLDAGGKIYFTCTSCHGAYMERAD